MVLGQVLFVLAGLSIVVATVFGFVYALGQIVIAKVSGRGLRPRPEPGSPEWMVSETLSHVDTTRKSLLTERNVYTTKEPIVGLGGERYCVTKLYGGRFLVTNVAEGRRIGTFELDGGGRFQEVIPSPDDPANAKLIVQIAVLSSFCRRAAA